MNISGEGVRWLLQAGKLIQSKSSGNKFLRKIVKRPGETYPEAVLREVHDMEPALQSELFDIVDWAVASNA